MLSATLTTDWAQLGTILGGSSEQAGYPMTNLLDPTTPDIPWKTTAAGVEFATIDLGSARAVQWWALLYTNFVSVQIWADDASTMDSAAGQPNYKSAVLTTAENSGNGRLCLYHIPVATVTRRFWRIVIPAQTPITGIPNQTDWATGFRLGAFLVAPLTLLRNFRLDFDPTPTQANALVTTVGGAEQESILGPERMRITGTRNAFLMKTPDGTTTATELLDDGVAEWMAFERRWKAAGRALIAPSPSNKYWVGLMRLASVSRRVGYPVDDASFEWREVS